MPDKPLRYDPPKEAVYVALAEAITAWSHVEGQLRGVFCNLLHPADWQVSAPVFNAVIGLRNQLDMISGAAEAALKENEKGLRKVRSLISRARGLGTKRNNLIHGRWIRRRSETDDSIKIELIRSHYPISPLVMIPKPPEVERAERGKNRFHLSDIQQATREFNALRYDLFDAIEIVTNADIPPEAREHMIKLMDD